MEYTPNEVLYKEAYSIFEEIQKSEKYRRNSVANLKKQIDKLKDEIDSIESIQRYSEIIIKDALYSIMNQTDPEGPA
tara:strand:- start:11858 stop:12088 length:231 start_codon:yes stop_codon:yes gene_type:complete